MSAACLVGALILAGSRQGGESGTGRAVNAVYDALWESRGQPATTSGPGLLMLSSPPVRQARTQALTRWNDAPGRTSGEVLAILDRAIARVIQDLGGDPRSGSSRAIPRWMTLVRGGPSRWARRRGPPAVRSRG